MPPPPGIWSEVDWGHLEPAPPFLTYTDGITLWSGDLRCEVRYVGTPAHTTNDVINTWALHKLRAFLRKGR